jgi:hypothetical protein
MRPTPPSPFDTLENCFRLLTTGPAPLAIDGRRLGHGLPTRQIPLGELRVLLHHPATTIRADPVSRTPVYVLGLLIVGVMVRLAS